VAKYKQYINGAENHAVLVKYPEKLTWAEKRRNMLFPKCRFFLHNHNRYPQNTLMV